MSFECVNGIAFQRTQEINVKYHEPILIYCQEANEYEKAWVFRNKTKR